jgi:hypothetical protein
MSSIFIQIPAYRDFEINKTVASAINNASGLNTLSFGIHNCVLFDGEIEVREDSPDWVKINSTTSVAPNNMGLQMSRYIANVFYNGEDYYFQVDSHMRFVKDWDTTLIDTILEYQSRGLPKPLISQYPPAYTYENDGTEKHHYPETFYQCGIYFGEFEQAFKDTLIPSQQSKASSDELGFTRSVSGGMIFTVGEFSQISPNPKIAFWGEEPLIAARAFTHGFDLVMPMAHSVCHLYHSQQPFSKVRRHHIWQDFPEVWPAFDDQSKQEYKRIFTEREIGFGAFGTERTLDEYEEFSGLNFRTGEITDKFK